MTSFNQASPSSTATSYKIDPSRVKKLSETVPAKPIAEADAATYQRFSEMIETGEQLF